jgi:MFS family permease
VNLTVFKLGLVSFFADISSEMLYPVTPLFLTAVLGSTMLQVGLIEGLAEGLASLLKTFFGRWSDQLDRRRPFVFFGYLLSALSKPMIGLSSTWVGVLASRSSDRVGKSVRTAPRDALLAESTRAEERGRSFGWHRGMDSAGAAIGPLLALGVTLDNVRSYYFWALIPGLLAALIVFTVREKSKSSNSEVSKREAQGAREPLLVFFTRQSSEFKRLILASSIFALGNSSDAFLLLKLKSAGCSFSQTILFYCGYNLIYSIMSPILGHWTDRPSKAGFVFRRQQAYMAGLVVFALVYFGFSFSSMPIWFYALLFAIYGLYMAATDGVSKALLLDFAGDQSKATTLGVVGTLSGVGAICASIAAGYLWDHFGSTVPFVYGAGGALLACLITATIRSKPQTLVH